MKNMRISAWAIRNPIPVTLAFIAMMIAGIASYFALPVTQFPDIEFPAVAVTVVQPGAAPTEIENQVTRPIENSIASISGIDILQSTVTQGASTTVVQFEIGYDVQKAADEVQSRVDQVRSELPREIEAPIVQRIEFTDVAITTYAVSAPEMSMEELSWFIDNDLSRRLQGLNGVARITRVGGVNREINVLLDPVRMAARSVTAPMINAAITQMSADAGGGRVEVGGREQTVRVLGAALSAEQVADLSIPVPGGRYVKLSDVAQVGDGSGEVRRYALLDGRPAVGFEVIKTKESSDVDVEDLIDETLQDMNMMDRPIKGWAGFVRGVKDLFTDDPAVLGPEVIESTGDIEVSKIYGTVYETRQGFEATKHTMLEGMLLAALVVWLFLRDWRATAITAIAMPTSLIPTFAVMALLGFSLNMVTLLALTLVIGILVDDAIVEIENIEKRIFRGERPYYAALEGADQIGLAVIATTFAIFVVFLPVSFMPGIPGQFFKEFGMTVCIAVLFSLVVARLLTPLLAAYFMSPKQPRPRKPLPAYYQKSLSWALRHRILSCIIGGVAFFGAIGAAVVFKLPFGLVPEGNPDFYTIDISTAPGSTIEQTAEAAHAVERIIAARDETLHIFMNVGSGALDPSGTASSGPSGANRATVTAVIRHKDRPRTSAIRDDILDELATVPDARVNFSAVAFGAGGAAVILTSDTGENLEQAAHELQRQMRTLPFLIDPRPSTPPSGPEIVIRPRPDKMAELGVTSLDIAQLARIATVGEIDANVAKVTAGERRIPIRVRLPEEYRADLPALRAMQIPTASGQPTTLDTVADIEFQAGPAQIDRFDRKRQITVRADLTQDVQFADAQNAVNNLPVLKNLPPGVTTAVAGEQQASAQLFMGFAIAMVSGFFLVYAVMVLLFQSFFKPVVIMLALPLAVGGAIVGLLVMGLQIDMPSLIGFLMLMGLAAKNSILLVEYAIEREREGMPQREAIMEACHERARPIVMTTFAMMAGMAPTALAIGSGSEFRQPMAVAVIGGLISSTLLSLLIVPVVYEIVDDIENWLKPKFGKLITPREAPSPQAAE